MSRERKDTRIHLVAELEKLPRIQGCPWLQQMIVEAKAGEYHDYKNQKYDCGKVASSGMLRKIGTPEAIALAERIEGGEFDEVADEEDKIRLNEMLKQNGMSAPGFKELFGL